MSSRPEESANLRRNIGRKVVVVLLGLVFALFLLEIGLRLSGAFFAWQQDSRNRRALEEGGEFVVLCVGESTTAMSYQGDPSYPEVLEEILNERVGERKFTVINRGVPASDSSVLISQLEPNLEKYKPRIVVAMMGANDQEGGAIPWNGTPVAERTGFPYTLRVYRLAALLAHQYLGSEGQKPGKPILPGGRGRPPMRGGTPGGPMPGGSGGKVARPTDQDLSMPWVMTDPRSWKSLVERPVVMKSKAETVTRIDERIFDHLQRARRALSGGRNSDSEKILFEAIAVCPECGDAPFQLAQQYEQARRPDEADAMYRRAIEANPMAEFYYQLYARFLLIEKRLEDAERVARKAMELSPDHEFAYITLGQVLEEQGRVAEAESMFLKAYEMVPRADGSSPWHRVFKSLAEFWDRHDRHAELEAAYLKALKEAPEDEFLLGRLGRFYEKKGRFADAAPYLQRANDLRVERFSPLSRMSYRRMQEMLGERGITLVAVQYPGRPLRALERLIGSGNGVFFVDNEETFRQALADNSYDDIFVDHCYGDFGHATREGNTLLASNVADVILRQVLGLEK